MRKALSPGFWARAMVAGGACMLALTSTGVMVRAAVVTNGGQGSPIILSDKGGDGGDDGHHKPLPPVPSVVATLKAVLPPATPKPKPTKAPKPQPPTAAGAGDKPKPAAKDTAPVQATPAHAPAVREPRSRAAATPAAKVVMDASDPVLFSAQTVAAADATRVLPVEALGPLSGISFGSGLFIWPLLVALDVFALSVIARMALRRRRASPED